MNGKECDHEWEMTNVRNGYLVMEGCFSCGGRLSFFSEEPVPPQDDYREGDHFWSYRGSFQATKFNLKCTKCEQIVDLQDVNALMLCTNCDPDCEVSKAGKESDVPCWAYVAICPDTTHDKGICVSEEGIRRLNEYYNQRRSSGSRIKVLPCRMRRSVDQCHGIYLADIGLTELY